MQFRTFFNRVSRHITYNSGRVHKAFDPSKPLTISEMMRRAQNGIPLSVYQPKNDNIPINGRFYTDDFDVLDLALRNDKRLAEESRIKMLEENARKKAERDEFDSWKLEQQKLAKEKATYVEKPTEAV